MISYSKKWWSVIVSSWHLKKWQNKVVDNYTYSLEFVRDCCHTQEMCNKAVDTFSFIVMIDIRYCHDRYKTQEMCDKAASEDLSMPKTLSW